MRKRHLRGVSRIEQQVNHRPWSSSLFAGELRLPTSRHYVVALDGSVVVGFGGLMYTGFEAHITNVAAHPDRRREQIATRMMLCLFADCRRREVDEATLEVRVTNEAAIELYQRFGFAPGGIRRNYYSDIGEDALIMWAHDLRSDAAAERLAAIEGALRSPLVTQGLERRGAITCP
ncbi:MAG TPA: ribosomal protein S18-alanine N-acetyltransferase [Microthrixaceae bacterium]|nr:ribosomal protein S18-alanine N-acetyltransferase [Microthrixaceae bacterium]